jgi:ABC-type sugar transport system ATPase subunit
MAAGVRIAVGDIEFRDPQVPEGEVLVGIRPEGLRPVGQEHEGPTFELGVEVVEPLGDEVLVHGSIDASPADVRIGPEDPALLADGEGGRATITLRLPPEERPRPGSRLRVAIAPHLVRLFDPVSGRAIRPT